VSTITICEASRRAIVDEKPKFLMYFNAAAVWVHGIDMDELRGIASNPDDKHLFQVDDYNALDTIKDLLVSRACEAPVNSLVGKHVYFLYKYVYSMS
jgi:hypothetical protein